LEVKKKITQKYLKLKKKNKFVKALLKMIGWNLSGGWSQYQD